MLDNPTIKLTLAKPPDMKDNLVQYVYYPFQSVLSKLPRSGYFLNTQNGMKKHPLGQLFQPKNSTT